MKPLETIFDLISHVENTYDNDKALNSKENGEWAAISTVLFMAEVKRLALGLRANGLKKGDIVGILAPGSPRWTIVDLAIIAAGGVTVPLFSNLSQEHFSYEVEQTEMKTIFAGGAEQWALIAHKRTLFTSVIALDDTHSEYATVSYAALLAKGQELLVADAQAFDKLSAQAKPQDLATIVYTSGSTGNPKGAELTHRALFRLLNVDPFNWDALNDRYLSLLPLPHIFPRVLNFIMVAWGVSIYYQNDLKQVAQACQEVHPTLMIVVPRLLQKVYAGMLGKVEHADFLKRKVGLWAFELANLEEESLYKQLLQPIADKVVYSALRQALGGSFRVIISGGAPLDPHLCHFFLEIGLPIYEGWGMTESCPITVNRIGQRKIGTVGIVLDRLEVKMSESGELLVRGENVMRSYFKNPEATARALDADGWLRTGDRGVIDAEGFVTIIGRIEEIYKTSSGKKVAPVPIEQELCKAALIDMALVIAEGRNYTTTLLFPDLNVLKVLKDAQGQSDVPDQEFLEGPFMTEMMQKLLDEVNQHLDHWEQVRKYRWITKPLSIESGDLTPTMKIRREVVHKKFHDLIEAMYAEESK